jgi:hypothetical protein
MQAKEPSKMDAADAKKKRVVPKTLVSRTDPATRATIPGTPLPAVLAGDEELGEGNKTAAKRYNEAVRETVKNEDVDALADEAKRALEGPEGEELRRAEEEGKKSPLKAKVDVRDAPPRPK